jgi:hypothetical protein
MCRRQSGNAAPANHSQRSSNNAADFGGVFLCELFVILSVAKDLKIRGSGWNLLP